MTEYVNKRLNEIHQLMEKSLTKDESADFFKGFISEMNKQVKHLCFFTYVKMKPMYYRTAEIDTLVNRYDYHTDYIDNSADRNRAEKDNEKIINRLRELGVEKFRNINV